MIMVLCLLIYSYAEWKLRRRLKEVGQSVPNQLKKTDSKADYEMDISAF